MTAAHSPDDATRYRTMTSFYERLCIDHPGVAKAVLVRDAGALAFDINIEQLISKTRKSPLVHQRMKVMAAARIISRSSLRQIGTAFNRDHATVQHARLRYGSAVKAALKG